MNTLKKKIRYHYMTGAASLIFGISVIDLHIGLCVGIATFWLLLFLVIFTN